MLPNDTNILLSIINMKLRDYYSSLDALCDDMDENKSEILTKLSYAGWVYNAEKNQFVRKV